MFLRVRAGLEMGLERRDDVAAGLVADVRLDACEAEHDRGSGRFHVDGHHLFGRHLHPGDLGAAAFADAHASVSWFGSGLPYSRSTTQPPHITRSVRFRHSTWFVPPPSRTRSQPVIS